MFRKRLACLAGILLLTQQSSAPQAPATSDVTRTTLSNGLRVVIIRNPLAPVVTVEQNYLVGGDETPAGFPGMAHAQEHMAFRGCDGLSADQIAAIYAQLGGFGNADTQQTITQYFTTVPAADLDVALHVDASCMQGVEDSQKEWSQEKGAIEQEVARDLSNPTYKFLTRLNEDMFQGTPYAHDPLGTKPSFDATTGEMLQKFHREWYAPNNALLLVVGDVDPKATLAEITKLYGSIPRHQIPLRPQVVLKPVKSESFTLDSNLSYLLAVIAYRMPGTSSPDYAAARVLGDVLTSQRANLYALVPEGKALAAEFELAETYTKASVGLAVGALPAGADGQPIIAQMKAILADYANKGVPAELVDAAKRQEIAGAEFERNSIPDLAATWSQALAVEGRMSPDEDVAAIRAVQIADVNRVANKYLLDQNSVTAILKPVPSGGPVASKGFGGNETLTSAPTKAVALPEWAEQRLASLKIPQEDLKAEDMKLPNGIRLIVKTVRTSPTITVVGNVRNEPDLEIPPGKEGVSDVLEQLLSYGTKTLDRLAFQKALDDIAASESAGFNFSLRVLKNEFSHGVALLADNELNPALPADAFGIVRQQTSQFVKGNLESPGYKAGRAVTVGLLPPGDPDLREVTPKTVDSLTLDDVKQYHAQGNPPGFDHDRGDWRRHRSRSAAGDREMVRGMESAWPEAGCRPCPRCRQTRFRRERARSERLQDYVTLAEEIADQSLQPGLLSAAARQSRSGRRILRHAPLSRSAPGEWVRVHVDVSLNADRTRGPLTGDLWLRSRKRLQGAGFDRARPADMQAADVTPGELQQAKALLLRQIPLRNRAKIRWRADCSPEPRWICLWTSRVDPLSATSR